MGGKNGSGSDSQTMPDIQLGEQASVAVEKPDGLGEAVDVYGDAEIAQDLGYVKRGSVF